MSRRRVIVLSSAAALLAMGVLMVLAGVSLTQTEFGREWVRKTIVSQIAPAVHGRIHVGAIHGGLLSGVTIDSLEIRDPEDSLFIATGPVNVTYDARDLIDRRVLLQHVTVQHPVVVISQRDGEDWNWRKVFPRGKPQPPNPERGFGDYVVIDSADVRDGTFILKLPWTPPDSLRGARRDSAIAYALSRKDAEIRRAGPGLQKFERTWRWTKAQYTSGYVRIADPDSVGRMFDIRALSVDESDPPFRLHDVKGAVRTLGDSAWLQLTHFDMPASTGHAGGKIVWGSGLPVRYDVAVTGDSVSMSDIAWVYATLPRTGGGRMNLNIRNNPRDLHVLEYAIRNMDVRTTKSRLTGNMTYGVGGPVLVLKDVDLQAAPVDWDLLRTLNGRKFPYDWQGTLTGRVVARGGPVNRFVVDTARMTFSDAHVPGAISRAGGSGMLDILFPAFTSFRGFDVAVEQLDLRTIEYLNKNFPKVGGTVSGTARLDSSWLDVRFRNADLTHRDGPDLPSRVTGAGRVTWGEKTMTYDLSLVAVPLSFTTLARSYQGLPLRGPYTGPLAVKGTVEDLQVTTSVVGAGGTIGFDGTVDAYPPGYFAKGTATLDGVNLRTLLERPAVPTTDLTAKFALDGGGDSLANLRGTIGIELDRSRLDSVRVYGGSGRLSFQDGLLHVDSLSVESVAARMFASGGLGLAAGRSDSMRVSVIADSLGGLRRYLELAPTDTTAAGIVARDSLGGVLALQAVIAGTIDTTAGSVLSAHGTLNAREVVYGTSKALGAKGSFSFADLLHAPHGSAEIALDDAKIGGVTVVRTSGSLALEPTGSSRFSFGALTENNARIRIGGRSQRSGDTTSVLLDTASVAVDTTNGYRLTRPALVRVARGGALRVDSLELRGNRRGRITAQGESRGDGAVDFRVSADSVSLSDLGLLIQAETQYAGTATMDWTVHGTRTRPQMEMRGRLADARFGGMRFERVDATAHYDSLRLDANLGLFRGGVRALNAQASLPLDLALEARGQRKLALPLNGWLKTDSVDLSVLEAFVPTVHNARGRVRADVELSGTWQRPRLIGGMQMADGTLVVDALGVRFDAMNADVALTGDSMTVRRFSLRSGTARGDTASLSGWVRFASIDNPSFDLRLSANRFLAMDRVRKATLVVTSTSPLTLTGTKLSAVARGSLRVDEGSIYVPELREHAPIDLSEFRDVVDTSMFHNRQLIQIPSAFVSNLRFEGARVAIGDDVWLRSPEANLKLGGVLEVRTIPARLGGRSQLALNDSLIVERGTYILNLGIARPIFEVERGTIRFYDDPDLNPTINISALYTVRRPSQTANRPDVRVRVTIGGTLNQPTLALSSPDDAQLSASQTDLLSYLVTGEPAYAILAAPGAEQGATLALRLASSYLSSRFSGGPFDIVQVQTSSLGLNPGETLNSKTGRDLLASTRIGLGGQLGQRTFYNLTTGFCPFGSAGQSENGAISDIAKGIGLRIEHRLDGSLTVAASYEPGTTSLTCGRGSSRLLSQTPPQIGFDLSRRWQF